MVAEDLDKLVEDKTSNGVLRRGWVWANNNIGCCVLGAVLNITFIIVFAYFTHHILVIG